VLQAALLRSGIEAVRPGGLVAYVTCSPHRFETREVVDEVTATGIAVERIDVRGYLPGVPQLGAGPDVQLWPHRHGTDAMYLSLLRRLS
jgi:16S rRNA (cytosine967-C5)-methyltransferase